MVTRIQIEKCRNRKAWYRDCVGKEFKVLELGRPPDSQLAYRVYHPTLAIAFVLKEEAITTGYSFGN